MAIDEEKIRRLEALFETYKFALRHMSELLEDYGWKAWDNPESGTPKEVGEPLLSAIGVDWKGAADELAKTDPRKIYLSFNPDGWKGCIKEFLCDVDGERAEVPAGSPLPQGARVEAVFFKPHETALCSLLPIVSERICELWAEFAPLARLGEAALVAEIASYRDLEVHLDANRDLYGFLDKVRVHGKDTLRRIKIWAAGGTLAPGGENAQEVTGGARGATSKAAGGSKAKRKGRGRPPKSKEERKREERIYDAWGGGYYRDYYELANEFNTNHKEVKRAIDNERKRRKSAGGRK